MQFEGEVSIEADSDRVWELTSDPEMLMSFVPGAREVVKLSETKYEGVIERSVADVTISLSGDAEIVELDPPQRIVADASGEDTRTNSRMEATAVMEITPDNGSSTLHYTVDVEFTGRLATLGSRIIKRKINSDIETFFDNLKGRAEGDDYPAV